MHKYEIEIKSLLGSKDKADGLVSKMKEKDANLKVIGSHKQLNHYFIGGNLKSLYDNVQNLLDAESREKLKDLVERAKDFSVRTRDADSKVILVVKASIDDTTSSNGTARLEWEHLMNLKLDELDKLVLDSGFEYQAKWSRERKDFTFSPFAHKTLPAPLNVSIDKNAGYGYLAEFEMVIDDQNKADDAKNLIRTIMGALDVDELPQDRLERMFKHYNQNWREYYGTDKTFIIE
jgi:adenylate cyclase class IV